MKLMYWLFNRIMLTSFRGENRRFQKALQDVCKTQTDILFSMLKANSQSTYGQIYGFSHITSVEEYQYKVPLTTYADYLPYIEEISSGAQGVLTGDKVLLLEPSSGSTAPSKFIPYTQTFKKQFQSGVFPWLYDLYTNVDGVLWGKAYWSITPAVFNKERTPGGIPIGFEEDAQYLGLFQQFLIDYIFAVPKEVKNITDITVFRYITLLFLLKEKHLTVISVWNPTFLLLLMNSLKQWMESLINDLAGGTINPPGQILSDLKCRLEKKLGTNSKRSEEIKKVLANHSTAQITLYEALWPNLSLISCWTNANAAAGSRELQRYFPRVKIQGKGLLATEGLVSFPLVGEEEALLSINSHFFEFIEHNSLETGNTRIKLAHEVEEGKIYSIVLTTGGGFYRYRLQDLVKVTGFTKGCPRLVFIGKEDRVSDYCGEKLNEVHVRQLIEGLLQKYGINPGFYMMAPEEAGHGIYYYVLYIELNENEIKQSILENLMTDLERGLQKNFHYRYCRNLGQLKDLKLFLINNEGDLTGTNIYHEVCRSAGQKAGDIKSTALHPKTGWSGKFPGKFFMIYREETEGRS